MLVLSAGCSWAEAGWGVHLAIFIYCPWRLEKGARGGRDCWESSLVQLQFPSPQVSTDPVIWVPWVEP